MTELTRALPTIDVTDEVVGFLKRDLAPHEEHAIRVPNLQVMVSDGVIRASRHIRTFDGCHPYAYNADVDSALFAVEELRIAKGWNGRVIKTASGAIDASDEALASYRFVQAVEPERGRNNAEQALDAYLGRIAFLADATPEQLVGYQDNLYVSAADPLHRPVTITAPNSDISAEALSRAPVRKLTLFTEQNIKKVTLDVLGWVGSYRSLQPVPLADVSLEIAPRPDIRRALVAQALSLARANPGEPSLELRQAIDTFNALQAETDEKMYLATDNHDVLYFRRYPTALVATVKDASISSIGVAESDDFKAMYNPEALLLAPDTSQLYVADMQARKAFPASQVAIDKESLAESALLFRR